MLCERDVFLKTCKEQNKGNGFYSRTAVGLGQSIEINVPRDRLSEFKSAFLEILKQNKQVVETAATCLYNAGLSTRKAQKILTKIFGREYSATFISNMFQKLYQTKKFRNYLAVDIRFDGQVVLKQKS